MHGEGTTTLGDRGSAGPFGLPTVAAGGQPSVPKEQHPAAAAALPRVRKPATVRCLGAVDVAALAALVQRVSDKAWQREDARKENDYDCFHHTRHIVFRFIEGNRSPWHYYSTPIWQVWRPWLVRVMREAVVSYGFAAPTYPKAMLARLQAGHGIDTHCDGEGSHPFTHRIHVPLFTNSRATLTVDDSQFHLRTGCAYEVNNLVQHCVHNGGENDRIHFVFEVFDQPRWGSQAST